MADIPWKRVSEIFLELIEEAPDDRAERLSELRAQDPGLGAEVARLLDAESESRSFLGERDRGDVLREFRGADIGDTLAGYEIVAKLGEGGMATVFEACGGDPTRTVAIKVLRSDLSAVDARRRFAFEAEVLAKLHHPHIAQVYHAAVDNDTGRPFFVMEYVPGARGLVRYAREERIGRKEILRLFRQAADAVAFGHRRGVLHRDLKSANVLVDGEGQVKVIDFGLARPIGTDGEFTRSLATEVGQLLGTLSSIAPEQLHGDDTEVDTRADVYGLGCMLYELIEDRPPIDVEGLSLPKAIQRLSSSEPREPRKAPRELRWILLRALAGDPERRYGTVDDFSQDLASYSAGEAIEAAPPSRVYRIQKSLVRHRALVLGTLAAFLALSLGLFRAEHQRRRAVRGEQDATEALGRIGLETRRYRVFHDLLLEMFSNAPGPNATAVELLHVAKNRVDPLFSEFPDLKACVEGTLGKLFFVIGEFEPGRTLTLASVAYATKEMDELEPMRIQIELDSMRLMFAEGRFDDAEELILSLEPRMRANGDYAPRVIGNLILRLALMRNQLGRRDEALVDYQRGFDFYMEHGLRDEIDAWRGLVGVAMIHSAQGRAAEAVAPAVEALANMRRLLGEQNSALLLPIGQLALIHGELGEHEKAVGYYEQQLDLVGKTRGEGAMELVRPMTNMVISLGALDRSAEAADVAEQVLALMEELPREKFQLANVRECRLIARSELARQALGREDYLKAAEWCEVLVESDAEWGEPNSDNYTSGLIFLAQARAGLGEEEVALTVLERSLALDAGGIGAKGSFRRTQLELLVVLGGNLQRPARVQWAKEQLARMAESTD